MQAVLQKAVVAVHDLLLHLGLLLNLLELASGVKQDLQKPLLQDLGLLTLHVLNVLTSAVVVAQVQHLHPDLLLEGLLLGLLLNPLKRAGKAKVVLAAR